MKDNPIETKENILKSAKAEFLEKGFTAASLRTIATNANLTTGAMYRHFENKDALFCALVDDAIAKTHSIIESASIETHSTLINPLGEAHHQEEINVFKDFIDYIYQNFDSFVLLLSCSAGSTHEHFVSEVSDLYTEKTQELINWMYDKKFINKKVDSLFIHILTNGMIQVFVEIVLHRIPKQDAWKLIETYVSFNYAGINHILEVNSL